MTKTEKVIKGLECCTRTWDESACPSECPYLDQCLSPGYLVMDEALEVLRRPDLSALDDVVNRIAEKAKKDGRYFSPYEVGLALVQYGHHDNRFKWGEIIKYSPSEVEKILNEVMNDGSQTDKRS